MILFLDIDGVISTPKDKRASNDFRTYHCWSKKAIDYLRILLDNLRAEIIITSFWRYDEDNSLKEAIKHFNLPVLSYTSTDLELEPVQFEEREELINKSINENRIKEYIVVDDWSLKLGKNSWRFFQTDPEQGLTEDLVNRILEVFDFKHKLLV